MKVKIKRITWAPAIQNNCFEVNEWPGNPGSEPFSSSHIPKGSPNVKILVEFALNYSENVNFSQ